MIELSIDCAMIKAYVHSRIRILKIFRECDYHNYSIMRLENQEEHTGGVCGGVCVA